LLRARSRRIRRGREVRAGRHGRVSGEHLRVDVALNDIMGQTVPDERR